MILTFFLEFKKVQGKFCNIDHIYVPEEGI